MMNSDDKSKGCCMPTLNTLSNFNRMLTHL